MTPESVESLMAEIDAEDQPDFGGIGIGEVEARRLMANHFCEIDSRLAEHGMSAEARLEIMAAIAAHTMVENMLLYVERLRSVPAQADFRDWMQRHGLA